jgi:hypothetical protein
VSVRRAYCSAVDRNVPVRLKPDAAPRDRLSLQDPADLICLDYRVRCTGWCCPLFSVIDEPEAALVTNPIAATPSTAPPQLDSRSRRWNQPT